MKIMRFILVFILIISNMVMLIDTNAQEPIPIILTNIELVTVDEDTAVVTWVTNLPADTGIQWGETDQLGNEKIVEVAEIYHMAEIDSLKQGIKYFYRIGSGGRWSGISNFTTLVAPSSEMRLKFAIVADTHYDVDGRNTPNGMMYGESVRLTQSLVDELNQDTSIDFVMTLGDLTNTGVEEDFQGIAATMNRLNVPWFPVLGNHDKANTGWSDWYNNSFGRNETYYTLDKAGFHLIVMDSAVFGQVQGGIDDGQLSWLEKDLDDNTGTPTLIFMHHMSDRTDIMGLDENSKSKFDAIIETRPHAFSIHSGHIHANIVSSYDSDRIYVSTAAVVSYPIGYSIMKLYEEGYTQSFHKIKSELAASEESRIKLNAASQTSDEEALGDIEDRSIVMQPPVNEPPEINSISIKPDVIEVSGPAAVTVSASDPDGDILSYIYEVNGGTISGSGSAVTYIAPQSPGTYTITVKVSDGYFTSSPTSAEVNVISKDVPEPPDIPDDVPDINFKPVIEKIIVSKIKVQPGESVTIEVIARDDNGDTLSYYFEAASGTITATGNKATWKAPDKTGSYMIKIWVSDGFVDTDKEEKKVYVTKGSGKEDTSGELPGFEAVAFIISIIIISFYMRKKF